MSASQVGGRLSVLPLPGLSHGHVDALQPLLGALLVLSFQHVRLAVGEDLEGARQAAIPPLLGHDLRGEEKGIARRDADADARRVRWRSCW